MRGDSKKMIPINTQSYDYRFKKTLNEDVELTPNTNNTKYDITIENGDYKNVTGEKSLNNAIIIAILTRYNEIKNPTYNEFGCRAHELTKDNQNSITQFKLETYITDTLENIRRIHSINTLNITPTSDGYDVKFSVTSINDEIVKGEITI